MSCDGQGASASVWCADVVRLLQATDRPDGQNADSAGRLRKALAQLTRRTEIWGALLNYPRTYLTTSGLDTTYSTSASRSAADYDQLISVDLETHARIKIGVVRLEHEKFHGEDVARTLTTFQLCKDAASVPETDADGQTDADALEKTWGIPVDESGVRCTVVEDSGPSGTIAGRFVYRAAAILEALMRDRVRSVETLTGSRGMSFFTGVRVLDKDMRLAVRAGVVPYAAKDVDDDTGQPPVMPGALTMTETARLFNKLTVEETVSPVGESADSGDLVTDESTSGAGIGAIFTGAHTNPHANITVDPGLVWASADGGLSPFDSSEDEFDGG